MAKKIILILGHFLQIIGWIFVLPLLFLAYAPIPGANDAAKYQFKNTTMRNLLMWLVVAIILTTIGSILLQRNKK